MFSSKGHRADPLLAPRSPFTGHGAMVGLVGAVIVAGYLVVHFTLASSCTVSSVLENSCRPWLGAVVATNAKTGAIQQFTSLETSAGHKLDVFGDNQGAGSLPLNSDEIHYIGRTGTYAYVNWQPAATWALADGNDNTVNAQIRQAADNIKAVSPHKIYLAVWPNPEQGIQASVACQTKPRTANNPAEYRAMWQNVETIFQAEGASNVVWVMNYGTSPNASCLLPRFWPGNNLVDWITFSADGTNAEPTWADTVGRLYSSLAADSTSTTDFNAKPWGIAGLGTCGMSNAGSAASYYTSAKTALDTGAYPKLKLYLADPAASTSCLSGQALAAFKNFADDPVFTAGYTPPSQGTPTPAPVQSR